MKVFIWDYVEKCSDSYRSGGGVVVFAETEELARKLANEMPGCAIKPGEMPDRVSECEEGPEQVFIMSDAGCC